MFKKELHRAAKEGVTHPENLPFFLEPLNPNGSAVLLVHGFSGSPKEMRLIGEALAECGFVAVGIRLAGHGTTPEDLAGRPWVEWLESVERGYHLLRGKKRIYGVGMSTGSLLLLALAEKVHLDGLVLLSPYLKLRHRLAPAAGFLRFFKKWHLKEAPNEEAFYYQRRPVAGVHQINRLIRHIKKILKGIVAPALVMSGEGDQTVHIASAFDLYQRLGSQHKEYHLFGPEAPHVLSTPVNPRWKEVLALSRQFFLDLEQSAEKGAQPGAQGPQESLSYR